MNKKCCQASHFRGSFTPSPVNPATPHAMKFKVTYYRAGKARRFLFPTIEAARAYCAKVHKITGLVLGIELA